MIHTSHPPQSGPCLWHQDACQSHMLLPPTALHWGESTSEELSYWKNNDINVVSFSSGHPLPCHAHINVSESIHLIVHNLRETGVLEQRTPCADGILQACSTSNTFQGFQHHLMRCICVCVLEFNPELKQVTGFHPMKTCLYWTSVKFLLNVSAWCPTEGVFLPCSQYSQNPRSDFDPPGEWVHSVRLWR